MGVICLTQPLSVLIKCIGNDLIVPLCLYELRKHLKGQSGRAVHGAGGPVSVGERVAVPFEGSEGGMLPVVYVVVHH